MDTRDNAAAIAYQRRERLASTTRTHDPNEAMRNNVARGIVRGFFEIAGWIVVGLVTLAVLAVVMLAIVLPALAW